MMLVIARELMEHAVSPPSEAIECSLSLRKVSFFDIGIIVEVLVVERERVISAQQDALRELSATPVLRLRERLLVLPIIGMIGYLAGAVDGLGHGPEAREGSQGGYGDIAQPCR